MLPIEYHTRYQAALSRLPSILNGQQYEKHQLVCDQFHLFDDCGLRVYYVPFHHLNPAARVALVGLTPGWTQMEEAFRAAKQGELRGLADNDLFHHIDRTGSFSGPLRANLVSMLDGIGLPKHLGISTCGELFDTASMLVHFTSVVSAPIFKRGDNYGGTSPFLLNVPKLVDWVSTHFATELRAIPNALIIPLGKVADQVIEFLVQRGHVDAQRCLIGFPHPSGQNGHRKVLYERGRSHWREQIERLP